MRTRCRGPPTARCVASPGAPAPPPTSSGLDCRLARSSELEIPGFAPSLPMFVGGISLGGCIAFNSILADREAGSGLFRWGRLRSLAVGPPRSGLGAPGLFAT